MACTVVVALSPLSGVYDQAVDRESAFELLRDRASQGQQAASDRATPATLPSDEGSYDYAPVPRRSMPRASNRQSVTETFAKQLMRTVAGQVGREIMRGVLGSTRRR